MFKPRVEEEILQEMVGVAVAQSPLTDVGEGSVVVSILGPCASGIATTEARMLEVRESFALENNSGSDLDARVADLPGTRWRRLPATPTSGSVLSVTRGTTTSALTMAAGTRFGRTDDGGLIYVTVSDVEFAAGVATVEGVRVVCLKSGTAGNCPANTINKIVSAPDDITSIQQTVALTTGTDREKDDELLLRVRAHGASLSRTLPPAIEAVARSFRDSLNVRAKHAYLFEDPTKPAYSELMVDDGSGFSGYVQAGRKVTGTIPYNGGVYLYHQGPATAPILRIKNTTTGVTYYTTAGVDSPVWVSIPEKGVVQLKEGQTAFAPGDSWEIGGVGTKYYVFTGFISELQSLLHGSSSNAAAVPGYIAAGCRVRVVPPELYTINLTIAVILKYGADFNTVAAQVRFVVQEYMNTLGPGRPLFLSDLYARLEAGVPTAEAFNVVSPTGNVSAPNPRLTLRPGNIEVV